MTATSGFRTQQPNSLRERVAGLPALQRYELIRDCVRDHVMHVIGLKAQDDGGDPLDEHGTLTDYGLDSLAAIDLKTKLQQSIGHALPVTLAFDFPSVRCI